MNRYIKQRKYSLNFVKWDFTPRNLKSRYLYVKYLKCVYNNICMYVCTICTYINIYIYIYVFANMII